MLARSSYNRLHDARLELKFDKTSEEQRCILFTNLLNDAMICIQFIRAINLYVNRLFDVISHVIYGKFMTALLQSTLASLTTLWGIHLRVKSASKEISFVRPKCETGPESSVRSPMRQVEVCPSIVFQHTRSRMGYTDTRARTNIKTYG